MNKDSYASKTGVSRGRFMLIVCLAFVLAFNPLFSGAQVVLAGQTSVEGQTGEGDGVPSEGILAGAASYFASMFAPESPASDSPDVSVEDLEESSYELLGELLQDEQVAHALENSLSEVSVQEEDGSELEAVLLQVLEDDGLQEALGDVLASYLLLEEDSHERELVQQMGQDVFALLQAGDEDSFREYFRDALDQFVTSPEVGSFTDEVFDIVLDTSEDFLEELQGSGLYDGVPAIFDEFIDELYDFIDTEVIDGESVADVFYGIIDNAEGISDDFTEALEEDEEFNLAMDNLAGVFTVTLVEPLMDNLEEELEEYLEELFPECPLEEDCPGDEECTHEDHPEPGDGLWGPFTEFLNMLMLEWEPCGECVGCEEVNDPTFKDCDNPQLEEGCEHPGWEDDPENCPYCDVAGDLGYVLAHISGDIDLAIDGYAEGALGDDGDDDGDDDMPVYIGEVEDNMGDFLMVWADVLLEDVMDKHLDELMDPLTGFFTEREGKYILEDIMDGLMDNVDRSWENLTDAESPVAEDIEENLLYPLLGDDEYDEPGVMEELQDDALDIIMDIIGELSIEDDPESEAEQFSRELNRILAEVFPEYVDYCDTCHGEDPHCPDCDIAEQELEDDFVDEFFDNLDEISYEDTEFLLYQLGDDISAYMHEEAEGYDHNAARIGHEIAESMLDSVAESVEEGEDGNDECTDDCDIEWDKLPEEGWEDLCEVCRDEARDYLRDEITDEERLKEFYSDLGGAKDEEDEDYPVDETSEVAGVVWSVILEILDGEEFEGYLTDLRGAEDDPEDDGYVGKLIEEEERGLAEYGRKLGSTAVAALDRVFSPFLKLLTPRRYVYDYDEREQDYLESMVSRERISSALRWIRDPVEGGFTESRLARFSWDAEAEEYLTFPDHAINAFLEHEHEGKEGLGIIGTPERFTVMNEFAAEIFAHEDLKLLEAGFFEEDVLGAGEEEGMLAEELSELVEMLNPERFEPEDPDDPEYEEHIDVVSAINEMIDDMVDDMIDPETGDVQIPTGFMLEGYFEMAEAIERSGDILEEFHEDPPDTAVDYVNIPARMLGLLDDEEGAPEVVADFLEAPVEPAVEATSDALLSDDLRDLVHKAVTEITGTSVEGFRKVLAEILADDEKQEFINNSVAEIITHGDVLDNVELLLEEFLSDDEWLGHVEWGECEDSKNDYSPWYDGCPEDQPVSSCDYCDDDDISDYQESPVDGSGLEYLLYLSVEEAVEGYQRGDDPIYQGDDKWDGYGDPNPDEFDVGQPGWSSHQGADWDSDPDPGPVEIDETGYYEGQKVYDGPRHVAYGDDEAMGCDLGIRMIISGSTMELGSKRGLNAFVASLMEWLRGEGAFDVDDPHYDPSVEQPAYEFLPAYITDFLRDDLANEFVPNFTEILTNVLDEVLSYEEDGEGFEDILSSWVLHLLYEDPTDPEDKGIFGDIGEIMVKDYSEEINDEELEPNLTGLLKDVLIGYEDDDGNREMEFLEELAHTLKYDPDCDEYEVPDYPMDHPPVWLLHDHIGTTFATLFQELARFLQEGWGIELEVAEGADYAQDLEFTLPHGITPGTLTLTDGELVAQDDGEGEFYNPEEGKELLQDSPEYNHVDYRDAEVKISINPTDPDADITADFMPDVLGDLELHVDDGQLREALKFDGEVFPDLLYDSLVEGEEYTGDKNYRDAMIDNLAGIVEEEVPLELESGEELVSRAYKAGYMIEDLPARFVEDLLLRRDGGAEDPAELADFSGEVVAGEGHLPGTIKEYAVGERIMEIMAGLTRSETIFKVAADIAQDFFSGIYNVFHRAITSLGGWEEDHDTSGTTSVQMQEGSTYEEYLLQEVSSAGMDTLSELAGVETKEEPGEEEIDSQEVSPAEDSDTEAEEILEILQQGLEGADTELLDAIIHELLEDVEGIKGDMETVQDLLSGIVGDPELADLLGGVLADVLQDGHLAEDIQFLYDLAFEVLNDDGVFDDTNLLLQNLLQADPTEDYMKNLVDEGLDMGAEVVEDFLEQFILLEKDEDDEECDERVAQALAKDFVSRARVEFEGYEEYAGYEEKFQDMVNDERFTELLEFLGEGAIEAGLDVAVTTLEDERFKPIVDDLILSGVSHGLSGAQHILEDPDLTDAIVDGIHEGIQRSGCDDTGRQGYAYLQGSIEDLLNAFVYGSGDQEGWFEDYMNRSFMTIEEEATYKPQLGWQWVSHGPRGGDCCSGACGDHSGIKAEANFEDASGGLPPWHVCVDDSVWLYSVSECIGHEIEEGGDNENLSQMLAVELAVIPPDLINEAFFSWLMHGEDAEGAPENIGSYADWFEMGAGVFSEDLHEPFADAYSRTQVYLHDFLEENEDGIIDGFEAALDNYPMDDVVDEIASNPRLEDEPDGDNFAGEHYRRITIDHDLISRTMEDFPALVELDASNFDFDKARDDGHDIHFRNTDAEMLDFERIEHNSAEETAAYRVELPEVSHRQDTSFDMFYGDSSAPDYAGQTGDVGEITTYVSEDFEGTGFPPDGWWASDRWERTTGDSHTGEASAYLEWDTETLNQTIATPYFEPGEDTVISFWEKSDRIAYYDDHYRVWIDDGEGWERIDVWEEAFGYWRKHYYDLGSYAGDEIRVGFQYYGDNGTNWYLDNFLVAEAHGDNHMFGFSEERPSCLSAELAESLVGILPLEQMGEILQVYPFETIWTEDFAGEFLPPEWDRDTNLDDEDYEYHWEQDSLDCLTCDGNGIVDCLHCDGEGVIDGEECEECGGDGHTECARCGGDGWHYSAVFEPTEDYTDEDYTVIDQGFSSTYFPPPGWERTHDGEGYGWSRDSDDDTTYAQSYMYGVDDENSWVNSYLTTDWFDFDPEGEAVLSFDEREEVLHASSGPIDNKLQVEYRDNQGDSIPENLELVKDLDDPGSTWGNTQINLHEEIDGYDGEEIRLVFHFQGEGQEPYEYQDDIFVGDGTVWHITDILLIADVIRPPLMANANLYSEEIHVADDDYLVEFEESRDDRYYRNIAGVEDAKTGEVLYEDELGGAPENRWRTQRVDLGDFEGQDVRVFFNYQGAGADTWYIDNFTLGSYEDEPLEHYYDALEAIAYEFIDLFPLEEIFLDEIFDDREELVSILEDVFADFPLELLDALVQSDVYYAFVEALEGFPIENITGAPCGDEDCQDCQEGSRHECEDRQRGFFDEEHEAPCGVCSSCRDAIEAGEDPDPDECAVKDLEGLTLADYMGESISNILLGLGSDFVGAEELTDALYDIVVDVFGEEPGEVLLDILVELIEDGAFDDLVEWLLEETGLGETAETSTAEVQREEDLTDYQGVSGFFMDQAGALWEQVNNYFEQAGNYEDVTNYESIPEYFTNQVRGWWDDLDVYMKRTGEHLSNAGSNTRDAMEAITSSVTIQEDARAEILFENFEDEEFPPGDWTANPEWERTEDDSCTGSASAFISWGDDLNEGLWTPWIELGDNPELDFCYRGNWEDFYDDDWRILVQDSDGDYHTLEILDYSDDWTSHNIELAGWDGEEVRIVFHYFAADGSDWWVDGVSITETAYPPEITTHPEDQTVEEGEEVSFSVEADGTEPLEYQWQRSDDGGETWNDISGANQDTYLISEVALADHGMLRCEVSNDAGEDISEEAGLYVITETSLPLYEDFDSNFIPEGWGATSTGDNINWEINDSDDAGGQAPEARFYFSPSTVGTQKLLTPQIDTSGLEEIELEFRHYISDWDGGYDLELQTSGNGGDTWTTIDSWPADDMEATLEEYTIDNSHVGSEEFQVAWVFEGDSYDISWWSIDDVLIEFPEFDLELVADPAEGGEPEDITDNSPYQEGDMVELAANPADGYDFVNWTDEENNVISEEENFTYEMPDEDMILTANYEAIDYTLTLGSTEGGIVEAEGESGDTVVLTLNVYDEIDITAIPDTGYELDLWNPTGNVEDHEAENTTFTMPPEDYTLTAEFEMTDFDLTVQPEEGGDVEIAGETVPGGEEETFTYNYGDEVEIGAIPEDTYDFEEWVATAGDIEDEYAESTTFTMPAEDAVLSASFTYVERYQLHLDPSPEEGGTVEGEGFYEEGEEATIEAIPATGYEFINWTDEDNQELSDQTVYNYTMPAEETTLTANFELIDYTLTVVATEGGHVEVDEEVTVGSGEQQEFTRNYEDVIDLEAFPDGQEGYLFAGWEVDGEVEREEEEWEYTMPDEDVTVTAVFSPTYELTLEAEPAEGGEVENVTEAQTGEDSYLPGTLIKIRAGSESDYFFENWTMGEEVVSTKGGFIYEMPAEDVTLTANFAGVEPETVEDPNLSAAISYSLFQNPDVQLTNEDLLHVEHLSAVDRGIESLEGLQHAENLKYLDLSGNEIVDLSPLQELDNLREIHLSYNRVEDISVLEDMENLKEIDISHNKVTGLEPLASLEMEPCGECYACDNENELCVEKPELRLDLSRNENDDGEKIDEEDLAHISGLENIVRLDVSGNDVGNLSPLENLVHLRRLRLAGNDLNNIENDVFQDLDKLVELDISDNAVSSLDSIEHLTELEILGASANEIDDTDAEVLADLQNLRELNLVGNDIGSIDFITDMDDLQDLDVSDNEAAGLDLSPLAELPGYGHECEECEEGKLCPELSWLNLNFAGNDLENMGTLQDLENLRLLDLSDTGTGDDDLVASEEEITNDEIAPADIHDLRYFYLAGNGIGDLEFLEGMTLKALDLSGNDIENIDSLAEVDFIQFRDLVKVALEVLGDFAFDLGISEDEDGGGVLDLANNQISDISPLDGKHFYILDLSSNQLDAEGIEDILDIEFGNFLGDGMLDLSSNQIENLNAWAFCPMGDDDCPICTVCDGTGEIDGSECGECGGTGLALCSDQCGSTHPFKKFLPHPDIIDQLDVLYLCYNELGEVLYLKSDWREKEEIVDDYVAWSILEHIRAHGGAVQVNRDENTTTTGQVLDDDGASAEEAATVMDNGGEPVVGAEVTAKDQNGEVVDADTTNADGRYTLALPGGVHSLEIEHDDYESAVKEGVEIDRGDTQHVPEIDLGEVELEAPEEVELNAEVRNAAGETLNDALIKVWDDEGVELLASVGTAEEGAYSLTVATGSYRVKVTSNGYLPVELEGVEIAADDSGGSMELTVEMEKYGDVLNSGRLNPADAVMVLRHVVGMDTLDDDALRRARVSGGESEEINIREAVLILRRIAGFIEQFPVENVE